MTSALDKVTILMTLTRQLTQVMDAESAVLRRVELAELGELQAEKQALADIYEAEFAEIRRRPEILGAVHAEARQELEEATRAFQQAAHRNTLALEAAQAVVERALAFIRTSLADSRAYGPPNGRGETGGEIVPFALDRTC
jgi:flagellar biosynthesis/type III secretory pathway chaperone